MKWLWISIIVIALGVIIALYMKTLAKRESTTAVLRVGQASYQVATLDTVASQAMGLSGLPTMAENVGALFVFGTVDPRYFWMHDMRFSLDVVWIRDGVVIGLQENIPHPAANDGQIARFQSSEPCNWVLELNAGQIAKQGIKVGDTVELSNT